MNWYKLQRTMSYFNDETNTEIYFGDYYDYEDDEILEDQIKGLEAVIEVMLSFSNDTETDVKKEFTDKVKKH